LEDRTRRWQPQWQLEHLRALHPRRAGALPRAAEKGGSAHLRWGRVWRGYEIGIVSHRAGRKIGD